MAYDTWMNDRAAQLADYPLSVMTLPGTHDSGTYAYKNMRDPGAAVVAAAAGALGLIGFVTWEVVLDYTITQERTIQQQLEDGIRYLDVRVDKDGSGTLYIVHGGMPASPKRIDGEGTGNDKGVIQDVRDFLRTRPREIVIMDFQDLQEMDSAGYTSLIGALRSELGPYLLGQYGPSGALTLYTSLGEIWGNSPTHGRVIVMFSHAAGKTLEGLGLWDLTWWDRGRFIASPWANTDDVGELKNFLYMQNPRHLIAKDMLAVLQGQLTTISNASFASLSNAAQLSNPKLMTWIRAGDLATRWNVVIADFYDKESTFVSTLVGFNPDGWPRSNDQTWFWGGDVRLDGLSTLNDHIGITPETDAGITAAVTDDRLYFFYRGQDTHRVYMSTYDSTFWQGNHQLEAITEEVDGPPGVAELGGELHLLYKAKGHASLRFIRYDGQGSWTAFSQPGMNSSLPPALTTFRDGTSEAKLLAVYKDDDTDDLKWAVYTPSTRSWTDHGKIKHEDSITDPQTNRAPAVAWFNSKVYLLYKGASSDTIYQSVLEPTTGTWTGNKPLSGISPATEQAPALAAHHGTLYLVYKGESTNLYQATFDGQTWRGNTKISATPSSAIGPNTDQAPALVSYGTNLYLFYKGANTGHIHVAAYSQFHLNYR